VDVLVRRENRAQDDGYRSELAPGLRASADAIRLAEEIGFAHGRLLALGDAPPGLYAQARELAGEDVEQATWTCFLTAYLSPLEGDEPFAGIEAALSRWSDAELPDLDDVPLGPRTSHDPGRGVATLLAYRRWAERSGSQAQAFAGEPAWSARRRFGRLFERLAIPGFGRMGRYDLLVTLGCLGLYELQADSLHLIGAHGSASHEDLTAVAAKRVFGIGDPPNLERRALALAEAAAVPIETLDLALANWGTDERATLGVPPDTGDADAESRVWDALGL